MEKLARGKLNPENPNFSAYLLSASNKPPNYVAIFVDICKDICNEVQTFPQVYLIYLDYSLYPTFYELILFLD